MLSSLLNARVTPWFCCAPLETCLACPPTGSLCHGLGQELAAGNKHLVPARGLGASAMAKDPGATWDTPPSLPPGELAVLQPGTIL